MEDNSYPGTDYTAPAVNYKNAERNKPCPCGSKKKFKKCHWMTQDNTIQPVNKTPAGKELLYLMHPEIFRFKNPPKRMDLKLVLKVLKELALGGSIPTYLTKSEQSFAQAVLPEYQEHLKKLEELKKKRIQEALEASETAKRESAGVAAEAALQDATEDPMKFQKTDDAERKKVADALAKEAEDMGLEY